MTDKEAKECFERVPFLQEQNDMMTDMNSIRHVLSQNPIDISQVRTQIDKVNRNHPENVIIYKIIFPPQGTPVSLASASDDNLISDLEWKLNYLQAKQRGKVFQEFCETMRQIAQENQKGGLK